MNNMNIAMPTNLITSVKLIPERHNMLTLIQEEIENQNRLLSIKVINNSPEEKVPGLEGLSSSEFQYIRNKFY